jgi:hypothetical protein
MGQRNNIIWHPENYLFGLPLKNKHIGIGFAATIINNTLTNYIQP